MAASNEKIGTTHFGLFLAILQCWDEQQYDMPFYISRSKLMLLSKIKSTSTYHNCIKDLKESGVIIYEPSFHPGKWTSVTLNLK